MTNVSALVDPLFPHNFEITFSGKIITSLWSNADDLTIRVEGAPLPGLTTERMTQQFADAKINYFGRTQLTKNDWQVTLKESSNMIIHDGFYKWMQTTHNTLAGTGSNSKDVKASAIVKVMNSAKESMGEYEVIGICPIALPDIAFTVTGSNPNPIVRQITFSIDWVSANRLSK
jgi:hypothetical protein